VSCWETLAGHDYAKTHLATLAEEAYLTQKGLILDELRVLKNRLQMREEATNPAAVGAPTLTFTSNDVAAHPAAALRRPVRGVAFLPRPLRLYHWEGCLYVPGRKVALPEILSQRGSRVINTQPADHGGEFPARMEDAHGLL